MVCTTTSTLQEEIKSIADWTDVYNARLECVTEKDKGVYCISFMKDQPLAVGAEPLKISNVPFDTISCTKILRVHLTSRGLMCH